MKSIYLLLVFSCMSTAVFSQTYFNITGGNMVQTGGHLILKNGNLNNQSTLTASGGTLTMKELGGTTVSNLGGMGITNLNNLNIDQASQNVQLTNNVTVDKTVTFVNGHLDLNNYTLTLGTTHGTISGEDETKSFIGSAGGEVQKTIDLNMPTGENPGNIGATITSTSDLGTTVIKRGHVIQSVNGKLGIQRYYTITPTTNTSLNATVRFAYLNNELNGIPAAALEPYRYNGITWDVYPVTGSGTGYVETSSVDSFSRWTLDGGGILLNPKAFLQGAYSGGTMTDNLRSNGLIPLTEPYTDLGFTQVNGGGETTTSAVLNVTGNDAIVDWIFLELRDQDDATVVLHTRSALIQKDGDIVDVDGVSLVSFPVATADNYFIVVRHRNHLGVMGLSDLQLSRTSTPIDFSSVATFGTNAQHDLGSGVMGLWGGNGVIDTEIRFQGSSNDSDAIKNAILGQSGNFFNLLTYSYSDYNTLDINMDGIIKFQGTNNDSDFIKNRILEHPGNFFNLLTFKILQQQP